jgi:hypothetical protein
VKWVEIHRFLSTQRTQYQDKVLLQRSVEEWPDACDRVRSDEETRHHSPMIANRKTPGSRIWTAQGRQIRDTAT